MRPFRAQLFHADKVLRRRTDRHTEANNRFS